MKPIYPLCPPPPLSAEERQDPYAELYDLPIRTPDEEIVRRLAPGRPMDPADAVPIEDAARLFYPGEVTEKNGYCLLPDGSGYSTVLVRMPNVTPEMNDFWEKQFRIADHDVRYKIWLPGMHFIHTTEVLENLGWGIGNVHFGTPVPTEDFLDAPPAAIDPDFLLYSGCSGYFVMRDDPDDITYNTLMHLTRRTPDGGITMQTINWTGLHLLGGKKTRKMPADAAADMERVRLFACHNAWENTRKGDLLPRIMELAGRNIR